MWQERICLRPGGRRPVRLVPYSPGEDLQGAIPAAWCEKCGSEVYGFGDRLCPQCRRWEPDEKWREASAADALPGLYPGTAAGALRE